MSDRFARFAAFSLLGAVLVMLLLLVMFQRVNRQNLESHYRDHTVMLANMLRNGLMEQNLLGLVHSGAQIQPGPEGIREVDGALRARIRDLPVAKVKIFDRNGVTVYSSAMAEIGRDGSTNPGVAAALQGRIAGGMVHRDRFNSFDGVMENRELHQQYVPIRNPRDDRVEGVFEIYSDVTPLLEAIDRTQRLVLLGVLVVLGGFLGGQLWLYHRTDRALIREQAQTQGYLLELEKARDQLEDRVAERTRELEDSRRFLQSVVDGIASPLLVIRSDLRVSMMNRAAKALVPDGADPQRFSHCYQISHRRDSPCCGDDHPCAFQRVLKEGTVTVRHTHRDASGNPIILDVISTPLRSSDGELEGVIEVEHDVTELVRTQQGLAASEQRLQAIMDHVPDAILTFDEQGRIETANTAARRMFGSEQDSLVATPVGSLICAEAGVLAPVEGYAVREACGLRKRGEQFPVDLWVGEMQASGSRRFIAVARDISERKRAEQELEKTRNQYYHQEKMASIGQLAAGILHEVGNPIAAIAGATQEMRSIGECQSGETAECALQGVVAQNLTLIEEHTTRLAKITREIAEFASPRPRERELFDLNGLIRSTARLMRYDRRFRNIELTLDLDTRLPAVEGVADQITQVLMNLLINAMDATTSIEGRSPEIQVVSRLAGEYVEVEVRDNGTGMDEDVRQHAREAFFTTKPVGRGTGLGLSLCDSILSAHGGQLDINSTPGEGTVVRISVPVEMAVPEQKTGIAV